jgi:membrane-associated protease RseP (regulator of RpoE activity)
MYDIVHYPFLFAGWFGLFITALNLLPIGQLDGGHIMYALLGRNQKFIGFAAFASIIGLALWYGVGSWIVWAILILVLIKIKHPPVYDEALGLDPFRKTVGIICMVIFILSFIPVPLYLETFTR